MKKAALCLLLCLGTNTYNIAQTQTILSSKKIKQAQAGESVVWQIDIAHFYDKRMDCGFGICHCNEAKLLVNIWFNPLIMIENKEVHCYGYIIGNVLKLFVPYRLVKLQATVRPVFTVPYPVNIINAEREIAYKIIPGDYLIQDKRGQAFILLGLQMD